MRFGHTGVDRDGLADQIDGEVVLALLM
jgi:hypothetical protein